MIRARGAVLSSALVLATVACGDDADESPSGSGTDAGERQPDAGKSQPDAGESRADAGESPADAGERKDAAQSQPDAGGEEPLYMVVIRVWAQDSTLQYAKLTRDLNLDFTEQDFKDAYEFGGYAGFTVRDGEVLVGDQETPFVTKYEITPDLKWKQVGEKLNFTDYFEDSGDGLNDHYQAKAGNDQFFFYGPNRQLLVHWLVDEWKITGASTESKLPKRDGWQLNNAGNRARSESFKDKIIWPFILAPMEGDATPESYLAVYDRKTNEETAVLHPECPELFFFTFDEDSNAYYSTFWRTPLPALYGKSVPNCVAKVKPNGTLDESFGKGGTKSFEELTGGLHGKSFRYMGKNKATVNVLNVDQIKGADFAGEMTDDVVCQVDECEGKEDLFNVKLWEFYVTDLETNTSKPITGYESDDHKYGNFRLYYQVEDRTFFEAYDESGNTLYELDLETAVAKRVGGAKNMPEASAEYTVISRIR